MRREWRISLIARRASTASLQHKTAHSARPLKTGSKRTTFRPCRLKAKSTISKSSKMSLSETSPPSTSKTTILCSIKKSLRNRCRFKHRITRRICSNHNIKTTKTSVSTLSRSPSSRLIPGRRSLIFCRSWVPRLMRKRVRLLRMSC